MENATKALLIAGSILIVILLIALGMRVFRSGAGAVDDSQVAMKATGVGTYNTQIAGYLNKNLTESQVRALVQKLIAINASSKRAVKIKFRNQEPTAVTTFPSGKYTAAYDAEGYIIGVNLAP